MEDDNARRQEHEALMAASSQVRVMVQESCRHLQPVSKRPVGKPPRVTGPHVCLGILSCFLQGWMVQLDLWRLIRGGMMEPFAPVDVTDQAIYNRLARAGEAKLLAGRLSALFDIHLQQWIRGDL
jgi:hypothetical protein